MNERRAIKLLDEHMINLIAAGEVIERSSSVVKELVENAIDAGANIINISLVEAGLKEIVVSDNGCGMDEHEIKLAILPHSTSKIKDETDLFAITTLGFRGEALASIIAVSNVKIKSCNGSSRGIMLGLKAGIITSEAYIGHPQGTEVQVRNLFFNTPARLQNLKSENVELSYVTDYVSKIALANPHIAFKLTNNDNKIFQSFGTSNLLEVVGNVYDVNVCKNMISIAGSSGLFKVSGFVSNLSVTRSSKNNITIIVNGRIVKNYNITTAIINAYHTLLTVGRYPICVIEVMVDYSLVDVNVHPTKSEVRFSDEDNLLNLINTTVSQALLHSNLVINNAEVKSDKLTDSNEDPYDTICDEFNDNDSEEDNESNLSSEVDNTSNEVEFGTKNVEFVEVEQSNPFIEQTVEKPNENYDDEKKYVQTEIDFTKKEILNGEDRLQLKKLYYIGQLFGTYILAQNEDGFYMIDQHAANERINYEKILRDLKKEEIVNYEIMFPLKLSFTPSEALLIKEKIDIILKLGITLEDFGGGTFIVRMVPIWMSKSNIQEYVEEIIMQIINDKKTEKYQFLDNMAKSLACKKSVKGNEFLSTLQVEYILEDLVKCSNPFTCPHGRPIMVKYSKNEIEKWFKRINN